MCFRIWSSIHLFLRNSQADLKVTLRCKDMSDYITLHYITLHCIREKEELESSDESDDEREVDIAAGAAKTKHDLMLRSEVGFGYFIS